MNKVMHKEEIEKIIADNYIGASNFSWENNSISFDFDQKLNHGVTKDMLHEKMLGYADMNLYLRGELDQANKTITNFIVNRNLNNRGNHGQNPSGLRDGR